ncbi:MATE family efflux transporter [Sorangium sp. So ce1000]|uniref:MATE family efflux transporter n=1 Tax=Sorangium sp. So ce1000 TaxID=3133325 RepID=UPI003F62289D
MSSPVIFTVFGVGMGMTLATNILVSQSFGARRLDELRRAVDGSTVLIYGLGLQLTVLGEIFAPQILRAMDTPADVFAPSVSYLRVYLLSLPFSFGMFALRSMLQGTGDSRTLLRLGAMEAPRRPEDRSGRRGDSGRPRAGLRERDQRGVTAAKRPRLLHPARPAPPPRPLARRAREPDAPSFRLMAGTAPGPRGEPMQLSNSTSSQGPVSTRRRRATAALDPGRTLLISCFDAALPLGRMGLAVDGVPCAQVRSPAHLVAPWNDTDQSENASLLLSLSMRETHDVVICGHVRCAALEVLLDEERDRRAFGLLSQVPAARATIDLVHRNYGGLDRNALREVTAQENVLTQLDHLLTYPLLSQGSGPRVHAWLYDERDASLWSYSFEESQFAHQISLR